MGSYFDFTPSLIPDHGTPAYDQWRSGVDSGMIRQLQHYCTASFDYEADLKTALQKLNNNSFEYLTDTEVTSEEEILNEVTRCVWSNELTIVRDLIDQLPEYWLVTQYEIERGILASSQNTAESMRRRTGLGPSSPYTNNPPPAPKQKPPPDVRTQGWIQIDVVDNATSQPVPNVELGIMVPDGSEASSGQYKTNNIGQINVLKIKTGKCQVQGQSGEFTQAKTLAVVGTGKRAKKPTANNQPLYTNGPYTLAKVKEYTVKAGDTLTSIAAENGLTETELTQYNWNTTDSEQIQQHLIEDLGGTPPETDGGEIIFEENQTLGKLYIPMPWTVDSMRTMSASVLRVEPVPAVGDHWVELEFYDDDSQAISNEPFKIILPDGRIKSGKTDANGLARVEAIVAGDCQIEFTSSDKSSPIALGPHASNLKWLQDRVKVGEEAKLQFNYHGAEGGEEVAINIYEHDADGKHDLVDTIISTLDGSKGESNLSWIVTDEQADADLIEDQESGETGPLKYFFEVELSENRNTSLDKSSKMVLTTNLTLELSEEDGTIVPDGYEIIIETADKQILNTESNNGVAIFEEIVVGPTKLIKK